jgi:hypothetical protein
MTRTKVGATILATGVLALLALGSPALAKDGDVLVRGTCSARSAVKLKLSEENGRIEIEAEVDQNRNGVPWTVTLTRDGVRVARAVRVTRPPSGSFELRRLVANGAGAEVVRVVATRRGERCTARATWSA